MKRVLLFCSFLLIPLFSVFSQKAPVVFGKVSQEDLMMKSYDRDTSAPAVILADYGWLDINTGDFTRIFRVKILKKAGYELANFEDRSMNKPLVRGITYNLEGDAIVKEKLKQESIFLKRLSNDTYITTVAMPGIKEGSIFDIEIKYPGLPYEWYFQSIVPVRHSELRIPYSPYVEFSKNYFGYFPLTSSENGRWVSVNVPSFKSEPAINSPENYMSKFEIEVRVISYPGFYKAYTTSWESVNNYLLFNTSFPAKNQVILCLPSIIDELKASGKTGDELLKAAFEAAKKIVYNGENSAYLSDESFCNHLKIGSGNAADVNFLLLQILKKLEVKAYPVVLSTRRNGILSQFNPSLNKLNYIIVAVKTDEGFTLLDATEKRMPYNLLPDRVINGNGRIVSDEYSQWIPLVSKGKETSSFQYDLTLNDDMTLSGTITKTYTDYAAWDFRDYYSSFNSKDEYARQAEKNLPGLTINDITVTDIEDIYKPVTVTMDVTIEGMATQVDNEIYIMPVMFDQVKESPFNAAERVYPINYSRLKDSKVNVKIKIPENMTSGLLPQPINAKIKNNLICFNYSVNSTNNIVEVKSQFNINALTITQDQYKEVRNVYNNMVSKHAEPIILKMK